MSKRGIMDERIHVLGIRHHGPGSAASVEAALAAIRPASVLLEGPPEADAIIEFANRPGMVPPVAVLVYEKSAPEQSRLFPFAEFSPEWRGMQWGLANGIPVRFIDLPTEAAASPSPLPDGNEEFDESEEHSNPEFDQLEELTLDPLTHLAVIAGYADGEAWWNALVEQMPVTTSREVPQRAQTPKIFQAILTAMGALRERLPVSARDQRREAYMRTQIAAARKEVEGDIVVICGAWHAPALVSPGSRGQDRALLKGFRRAKVESCWVPWTDQRLSAASGYGAGVISPGWYRHLWEQSQDSQSGASVTAIARWQGRAARLLRDEGQAAATASVIEATRLSETLAALRGHAIPGLADMRDASLAALCHGEPAWLKLIEEQLIIGQRLGRVDAAAPQPPLLADLTRLQRKLRLKPEALAKTVSFDLRTPTGMAKSELFHRLELLNVPWGQLVEGAAGRGTFREIWQLEWTPELAMQLADAIIWGSTIASAAESFAIAQSDVRTASDSLADLVRGCLLSNLPTAAEAGIARLQTVAVQANDLRSLMDATVPLTDILRYGTARTLPETALRWLLESLSVEICAGLHYYCRQLDDAQATQISGSIGRFDRSVRLMDNAPLVEQWQKALGAITEDVDASRLVAGQAQRILYDQGVIDPEQTTNALSRALSPSAPIADAGAWLEGFLGQTGEVLLHDSGLLQCVDRWISEQSDEGFVDILPMLRRAFSVFDKMLRRRLLEAVRLPHTSVSAARPADTKVADTAFARAEPLLKTILGLSP